MNQPCIVHVTQDDIIFMVSCNSFNALMILLDSYLVIKIQHGLNLHSDVYNCQHSFSPDRREFLLSPDHDIMQPVPVQWRVSPCLQWLRSAFCWGVDQSALLWRRGAVLGEQEILLAPPQEFLRTHGQTDTCQQKRICKQTKFDL